MLTLDQLRKIDPDLSALDDQELEQARDALYQFAQLAFDFYWARKNGSKNPVGLFPPTTENDKLKPWNKSKKQE